MSMTRAGKIIQKEVERLKSKKHKIILIYSDELLMKANLELTEAFEMDEETKDPFYPIIVMMDTSLILKHTKLRPDMVNRRMIPFPLPLIHPLTVEQCKKILQEEVKISLQAFNVRPENREVLRIAMFFQQIVAHNMIDEQSQKNFMEALIDFSKEYTLIMPDPRCKLGGIPMSMMSAAFLSSMTGTPVTVYKPFMAGFLSLAMVINLKKELEK